MLSIHLQKVLLLLLFISFQNVFAQKTIYYKESPESFLVKKIRGNTASVTNDILEKIDEYRPKKRRRTQFTFSYTKVLKIIQRNDKLQFQLSLRDIKYKGDTLYRGFGLGKILFPHRMNFSLYWLDENNKLLKRFDFKQVIIDEDNYSLVDFLQADSVQSNTFSLKLLNEEFIFDEENRIRFDEKIAWIDEYYYSVNSMLEMYKFLRAGNLDNPLSEKLAERIQLDSLLERKELDSLYHFSHWDSLAHQNILDSLRVLSFDSLKYLPHFEKINTLDKLVFLENIYRRNIVIADLTQTKNLFDKITLRIPDEVHLKKGFRSLKKISEKYAKTNAAILLELQKKYHAKALQYFDNQNYTKSRSLFSAYIDSSHYFAPSFAYLAKIDFLEGKIPEAVARLAHLKKEMEPDTETFRFAKLLGGDIYRHYLSLSDSLNKYFHYSESLEELKKAAYLCAEIKLLSCSEQFRKQKLFAHNGLYFRMLRNAERAYKKNLLDSAENALQLAVNYQISNNLSVHKMLGEVKAKINYAHYENRLFAGKKNIKQKSYLKALADFDEAILMEKNFRISHEKRLDSLINIAAGSLILVKIRKGESEALSGNLHRVNRQFVDIQTIKRTYKIEPDSALQFAILRLENLFKEGCIEAEQKIEAEINIAVQLTDSLHFIEAYATYDSAIEMVKRDSICNYSLQKILDKKLSISHAVSYQKSLIAIRKSIDNENYTDALIRYKKLAVFYQKNELSKFYIKHLSPVEFVKTCSPKFVNYSASHFVNEESFEDALDLLTFLEQQNYKKNLTKNTQTLLGERLATKDFTTKRGVEPVELLQQYTKGSSWFKYFESAYQKQWKSM